MKQTLIIWLIWLPLAAAPAIYLLGRLLRGRLQAATRWAALLALLGTWLPYFLAWQTFREQGPLAYSLGTITLRLDGLSLLLAAAVLLLATLVTLFSGPAMQSTVGEEKYYAMLTAMAGTMIGLGCAADLFNLWLWFEAMAVTSYLLVAFYREEPASLEAGVKYLVQSVAGSVLVLFGVALVLAQTGTLDLLAIREQVVGSTPMLLAAGGLMVVGYGVKIALVPLHTWLPDAHAQAPSGISALLSGIVIEAALIALLRALASLADVSSWGVLLMAFGALNMLAGNLLALPQKQVKRLLAFSSISHIGYMLVGLGIAVYSGEAAGAQGGLFHLLNHGFMKGLAFLAAGALLYLLHTDPDNHQPLTVNDISGIAWRYPLLALALTIALLGLGGIPPLAGFMSKWQILAAGLATHEGIIIGLVLFTAFNSLLSLAYYMPLVQVIFRRQVAPAWQQGRTLPAAINAPLVLMALAIVVVGLWPDLVRSLTEPAAAALVAVLNGQ